MVFSHIHIGVSSKPIGDAFQFINQISAVRLPQRFVFSFALYRHSKASPTSASEQEKQNCGARTHNTLHVRLIKEKEKGLARRTAKLWIRLITASTCYCAGCNMPGETLL